LTTFNFLIGNTDFHAKNISFLRHANGRVELAPAYDLAMHLHHLGGERKSALDINGKTRMDDITITDLIAEGSSWRMRTRDAELVVRRVVEQLGAALDEVDPTEHPGVSSQAIDTVRQRIKAAADELDTAGLGVVQTAPERDQAPAADRDGQPARARRRGPRRPRPS